ncbi:polysaccharide export protein [Sphingobium sufflavum]|uniref:polysaccharide biosynthesis/export family protein n=1 Tax=Sphingobium sufflavum TaxID=1129547 RepID=UPI001F45B743|nr:polysaccharide biosynthesis/export family protein [Sphingobium sufflavum]MCE7798528.1 polysaccharide export protein [Sphingobium sufflavum]
MVRRILFCILSVMAAMMHPTLAAAQGQPPAPAVSMSEGYVLGTGDLVEVTVLGRDEFKPRVQVQSDGTIQLPFLGTVPAANKTVIQLRDDVRAALKKGGYYADPIVNVAVATYSSRYVTVLGEVGTPGLLSIDRAYRVSEIIARVGGIKPTGSDNLELVRASGERIPLSFEGSATGGPAQDPVVNPGDKLFVPQAETFSIQGQVNAPGVYPLGKGMTVLKALARGGGLTSLGSNGRIKVYRDGKELRGLKPLAAIQADDVVVVGERFF